MSNQLCRSQRLIEKETNFYPNYLFTLKLKERVEYLTRSFDLVMSGKCCQDRTILITYSNFRF